MVTYRDYTDEDIIKNAKEEMSLAGLLRSLGLKCGGGSYVNIKKTLQRLEVDCSHWTGSGHLKGKKHNHNIKFSLESVMIADSTYSRCLLKRRLLEEGILKNECSECGQEELWNGQKLVMVLDHINGVNNDHRLENLRMLCPNCNSQQKTFCGGNKKKKEKKEYWCTECSVKISSASKSGLCCKCVQQTTSLSLNKRKVKNRPSKEQLLKEIEETNYCAVGRKYGVSDNTIRKWLKYFPEV